MNPSLTQDVRVNALEEFEGQLEQWKRILSDLREKDLQKTKTSISISSWVKLQLGDTLRVVIYHQERHLKQALQNKY